MEKSSISERRTGIGWFENSSAPSRSDGDLLGSLSGIKVAENKIGEKRTEQNGAACNRIPISKPERFLEQGTAKGGDRNSKKAKKKRADV